MEVVVEKGDTRWRTSRMSKTMSVSRAEEDGVFGEGCTSQDSGKKHGRGQIAV
jgi:hypothetical protein